jgi:hypothetical protein
MQKPPMHDDMDKFWRQTLRWLVTDVPGRISLQAVQRSGEVNQPVALQVRVRDKAFEPVDSASIAIEAASRATSGYNWRRSRARREWAV